MSICVSSPAPRPSSPALSTNYPRVSVAIHSSRSDWVVTPLLANRRRGPRIFM